MKEFKGTRGKWIYNEDEDIITDECGQIFIASFYNGLLEGGLEYDIDAQTHNARLLAAAPDLLEALQSIIGQLKSTSAGYISTKMMDRAKNAIARALGEKS